MSTFDIDLEKQQPSVAVEALASPKSTVSTDLSTYQTLVGDVDAPSSPVNASDTYQQMLAEERSATRWFYITATLMYSLIITQIVLCLGIVLGSQQGILRETIAILAGVNTVVAACIAVLKGFGLPEKKDNQRLALRKLIGRVRQTTRKLRAGLSVDASKEAEDVRLAFEGAEDLARFQSADVVKAAESGLSAGKTALEKK